LKASRRDRHVIDGTKVKDHCVEVARDIPIVRMYSRYALAE
jgi:hypothetical protein